MLPLGKQAFPCQQDVTVSAEAHNLLWEPGILLRGCEYHSHEFPFFRSEFPGDHACCKLIHCNGLRR
jgi:hypothetical protein